MNVVLVIIFGGGSYCEFSKRRATLIIVSFSYIYLKVLVSFLYRLLVDCKRNLKTGIFRRTSMIDWMIYDKFDGNV